MKMFLVVGGIPLGMCIMALIDEKFGPMSHPSKKMARTLLAMSILLAIQAALLIKALR